MMFVYAEKDKKGKAASEFFFNEALVGKGNARLGLSPLNDKYLHQIKGADQLSGVALLGNDKALKTENRPSSSSWERSRRNAPRSPASSATSPPRGT